MSKTVSRCLATTGFIAGLALSLGTGPAGAVVADPALRQALAGSDVVLVQDQDGQPPEQRQQPQQRRKQARTGKRGGGGLGGGGKKFKLSDEHKQKIREAVPREYQQYLPSSITGGGGAGGR